VLGYLKRHPDQRIGLNLNKIDLMDAVDKYPAYYNWRELYPEAREVIPDDGIPELTATRIATSIAMECRYIIRRMGFALDGPINMFGDNQAVILNTTIPSSQLKKKIHACTYHLIREMISCTASCIVSQYSMPRMS
jgi:hypothetical protein